MAAKARILIIDDDDDYRASTRALLEGDGYEVVEAAGGPEGIEAVRAQSPDLIVLDIMMESPVEGYTVVQALKFHGQYTDLEQIPILMVSSVKQDPATLFPMAGDMPTIQPDAYMTKPLDIPKFLESVRNMLAD
ncbi:MAG: response regulator [Planctomycetes bacterium]|nr:response regulator [Planctomycetota bacterium]